MVYRTRINYTAEQKSEMWDRWQRGESLNAIGRVFDRPSSSIFGQLAPSGGIRPPPRQRSRLALTLAEREEISRGIAASLSLRSIATPLGRSPSTISRELRRNGGYDHYRATPADQAAWDRARRPKRCKLACHRPLRRTVAAKLRLNWSPEQIAGWLKSAYPEDERHHVSHETIYRSLFVQACGVLKKELLQHLKNPARHTPIETRKPERMGLDKLRMRCLSVSDRPAWKTARFRVTGRVISWPVRKTVT